MKPRLLWMAALLVPLSLPGLVQAKGCIKGAAIGGVAGHVAGEHGVIGAAAGCAIGHHQAEKKEEEKKAQAEQDQAARDKGSDSRQSAQSGRDETRK
jgi:hypothetical protein